MVKSVSRRKTGRSGRETLCRAVLEAAAAAGEQFGDRGLVSYLQAQASAVPGPFLTLLGKVLASDAQMPVPPVTRIEIVTPRLAEDREQADPGEKNS